MRFSRNWLAEYVELPESIEELADALTSVGLAVETTEAVGDDVGLEIEVTSNRPDCMSHLGLARELAARLDRTVVWPDSAAPGAVKIDANEWGSITLEDPEGCPRYVGVIVRGVEVEPSPDWLRRRLEAVGVRPINNIVDVTNYVLWEHGQPLHAFDLETLRGAQIVVRSAREGERITTLDGEKRSLDPEVLVIADAQRAVALAGVMGGLDTEVSGGTSNVLIESAHFDPRRVRVGAKQLALHTDASHRFERGADLEGCLDAALRAAALIVELAGGEMAPEVIDARAGVTAPLRGELSLAALERFAGIPFEGAAVDRTLSKLGFLLSRTESAEPAWTVEVPSWRRYDFETDPRGQVYPAYFYEEVLRHHGFEEIPATLPRIDGPDAGAGTSHRRRERIRKTLTATGLAETITYAFGSAAADRRFEGLAEGPPLGLANALSEQYAVMRRSLLPGLIEGALFNLRRGAEAVRLYELGHLFPGSGAETDALGVVVGGVLGSPWRRSVEIDLFDLKGLLEELAAETGASLAFEPAEVAGLVSGTVASIKIASADRRIGYLGRVDAPETATPLYAAELETAQLGRRFSSDVAPPSRHPGVAVDLTLTHDVDTSWAEIARAIEALDLEDLSGFELRDRYSGKGVPEGAVNTTVAFRYNAEDRSLTQEEVNERHRRLVEELEGRFGST